jgi:hypothetical protein
MCIIECPHCIGSTEVFNGSFIVECDLCDGSGIVSQEVYEMYIDDQFKDSDPIGLDNIFGEGLEDEDFD